MSPFLIILVIVSVGLWQAAAPAPAGQGDHGEALELAATSASPALEPARSVSPDGTSVDGDDTTPASSDTASRPGDAPVAAGRR
jgi:hypothetical protein